ncbi:hypothetical protein KR054_011227 [Drosophila jambulina]|nr:hypothetical protein KR054_011227 [Drosophila jambulina]
MYRFLSVMIVFLLLTSVGSNKDLKWSLKKLKGFVSCQDKVYRSSDRVDRDFWVLENYIKADHGSIPCYSNVTYTTHSDYRYLDNVVPLLERWRSPLSLAIYAPGEDFDPTLRSILYLLQCHPGKHLVRELTSFHLFFDVLLMPKAVPTAKVALSRRVNCSSPAPYENVRKSDLYRSRIKANYPVNVGRNIARGASLTHFVLASDIELYPSLGLVPAYLRFLSLSVIPRPELFYISPMVHVLRVFEVEFNVSIPNTKLELQELLNYGKAVPFHTEICEPCHRGPKLSEWIFAQVKDVESLSVFNVGQRLVSYVSWEPIFIGTIRDPPYDERLSWEGQKDKMTQAYAMCVLNYTFQILDNAFLVHKPGIKPSGIDTATDAQVQKNADLINHRILYEMGIAYGYRRGCELR